MPCEGHIHPKSLSYEKAQLGFVAMLLISFIMAGLVFAGTQNENAQELLYDFAVYFLNEVCP